MNAGFRQDVHYALRALLSRPLYALASIAVLAIAIGANTTVFSVFNGLFLQPLPYPDGDRLVMVYDSYPKQNLPNAGTAIPDYLERREQAKSREDLAIVAENARTLVSDGPPQRVNVARASPALFDVLRTAPALGRVFTEDEATLGNDNVIMLSHRLWNTRFGAREDVVGSDVRLDTGTFRVIGVMPENFGFPRRDSSRARPAEVDGRGRSPRMIRRASSMGMPPPRRDSVVRPSPAAAGGGAPTSSPKRATAAAGSIWPARNCSTRA